jgi:hypothetical protein
MVHQHFPKEVDIFTFFFGSSGRQARGGIRVGYSSGAGGGGIRVGSDTVATGPTEVITTQ